MSENEIGQKILEARTAKRLSQKALGALCGVSGSAVKKWEKGQAFPDWDKWPALEQALGLPDDWFNKAQRREARQRMFTEISEPLALQAGVNHGTVAGVIHAAPAVPLIVGGDIARDLCRLIAEHLEGKGIDAQYRFRERVKKLIEEDEDGVEPVKE